MDSRSPFPSEIDLYILANLSIKDLSQVARASKRYHQLANDEFLWSFFAKRDFNITFLKQNSKENYKTTKLGLSGEKECFLYYHLVMMKIFTNTRFLLSTKLSYQSVLDSQIGKSREEFLAYCKTYEKEIPSAELLTFRAAGIECFKEFLSQVPSLPTDKFLASMFMVFKLNAYVINNIIIQNILVNFPENASHYLSLLLTYACQYPCLKIINQLIKAGATINEIHCIQNKMEYQSEAKNLSPLASAILSMIQSTQTETYSEIILLLLENGADTTQHISMANSSTHISIQYYCMCILNKPQVTTHTNKNLLIDTLNKIIDHSPMNLSPPPSP